MSITADLQSLTPGNLITLFDLDLAPIGEQVVLRFFADTNPMGKTLKWDGNEYTKYPMDATGFERTGKGTMPRPKLSVANVTGEIGALGRMLGGLEGAKLTRTRTFLKYLDAENFPGGVNPTADPNQYIDKEIWYVSRRGPENKIFIEYELAASFDLGGIKLPRRQIIQNVCTWRYRSAECGYAGGPCANVKDEQVFTPEEDVCGKRLSSCKLRFGANSILPYGGFPGAGLIRSV